MYQTVKVKPKLKWKLKDVGDARTMGNLPWKALPYTKRETVTSGRAGGEGLCSSFEPR